MPTTVQSILSTLKASAGLPAGQVNYGVVQNLQPPYLSVTDFEYELVYDTCGDAIRHSTFHVLCLAADADSAQALAEAVLGLLDLSTTLTPAASRCLLVGYTLGQMAEDLTQYAVDLTFRLEETI